MLAQLTLLLMLFFTPFTLGGYQADRGIGDYDQLAEAMKKVDAEAQAELAQPRPDLYSVWVYTYKLWCYTARPPAAIFGEGDRAVLKDRWKRDFSSYTEAIEAAKKRGQPFEQFVLDGLDLTAARLNGQSPECWQARTVIVWWIHFGDYGRKIGDDNAVAESAIYQRVKLTSRCREQLKKLGTEWLTQHRAELKWNKDDRRFDPGDRKGFRPVFWKGWEPEFEEPGRE
jgi:hypothetical protein